MNSLLFSLLFYVAVHSFTVEVQGSIGDKTSFLEELKNHGIEITGVPKYNPPKQFGEYRTDGIILCLDNFNENEIIDYINTGHSVLVFMPSDTSQTVTLLEELNIESETEESERIMCDYVSPTQDKKEVNIPCRGYTFTSKKGAHAQYYSVLSNTDSSTRKSKIFTIAAQGNSDGRIGVFGDEYSASDEEYTDSPSSFSSSLDFALWVFKQKGVMRGGNLTYRKIGDEEVNPKELTISDNITFSVDLEVYDSATSSYIPYSADDVQLDITMLVPRIRKTLASLGNGTFSTNLTLPDIFGVYQYIVDYHAVGYTPVNITHQFDLHPLYHNQHPRYVFYAYPFYIASFIMAVAVILLSIKIASSAPFFLNAEETKTKTTNKVDSKKKHE